jgi:hypothetical protein
MFIAGNSRKQTGAEDTGETSGGDGGSLWPGSHTVRVHDRTTDDTVTKTHKHTHAYGHYESG